MMGLFDKLRKKKNITNGKNEIDNRKLKEGLGASALSVLEEGVDYDSLESTTIEFGYLFTFDKHGIEALFKIITDKETFYFACQQSAIIMLDFNEDLFRNTTEQFLELHNRPEDPNFLDEASKRKQQSIEILKNNHIPYIENLPKIELEKEVVFRTKEEIARRAVCCMLAIQHSFDLKNDNAIKESHEFLYGWLENWGLTEFLTQDEKDLFNHKLTGYKLESFGWKYEAYWVLAWALGLVSELELPTDICDMEKAISFVKNHKTFESFLKSTKLREPAEILDEADLIYRLHWAVREAGLKGKPVPANLDSSVVMERHMAFNWLINVGDDWDNMDIST